MPSLDEVLAKFPDKSFLIHIKGNDPEEGRKLATVLKALPESHRSVLAVYGGDRPIEILRRELPELRTMSKATLKKSLLSYFAIGWTGYVPASCRGTQIHIPEKYAPLLWGWPDRFLSRMEKAGTRVILVTGEGDFSAGFDSVEDLKRLPEGYRGGIWTNRIDRIAPAFGR